MGPVSGLGNRWKEAGSVYTFGNPAVVDFSSIQDGSIAGRIDFTIATGKIDFDFDSVSLGMIDATSASGGAVVTPIPVLSSIVIVPEPTPLILLGLGLAGLGLGRRARPLS